MSRSFSYNADQIIPIIQMRFIQNPFEKQCVKLDPSWSPPQPLHDTFFNYDFAFEQDVLTKCTEQLQNVVASGPSSNQETDELVIPIENLIATTNVVPSTLEPIPNGNSSQVNIEDFDSHNTDPFQDAELKTINDLEELQTLIFPSLPSQIVPSVGDNNHKKEIPTITAHLQDLSQENPFSSNPKSDADISDQTHQDFSTDFLPHNLQELPSDSKEYSASLYLHPGDASEPHSGSLSPKPPVPAPRKLKGNSSQAPNSPTPIPRLSAPKATPPSRPITAADAPNSTPLLSDALATVLEVNNMERNQSYVAAVETPLPEQIITPSPPYVDVKQEYSYPEPSFGSNPSHFQPGQSGLVVDNLTDSLYRDIGGQINLTSPFLPPPQDSHMQYFQSPLSEEERFYRKMAGMGFPLDRVRKISESFNIKDEDQLVEHFLAIQNIVEEKNWPQELVETTYVLVNGEFDKLKPYIETFLKYKEMGFDDEKIHSALEKCGKDYEKMLEILIGNP